MTIAQKDIDLVAELETYTYGKSMGGIVPSKKQDELKDLKRRLSALSKRFKDKYDHIAGPFLSGTSSGNPISFHGKLRRVWSGIFKGSENKQYSAQISFVVNARDKCLDVGFYFGRAATLNVRKDAALKLKIEKRTKELGDLGTLLYNNINQREELREIYYFLFNQGFKAEIKDRRVTRDQWLQNLIIDPSYSSIVFNLLPNENGEIEFSDIDFYVNLLLPLIAIFPEQISSFKAQSAKKIKSLTPEQWAKRAEKRALIGLDGEKFIMKVESERLNKIGVTDYPIHRSLISDGFGYDILSIDDNGREIFIEVKTTTLMRDEQGSSVFFMSSEEYSFYEHNKTSYRIIRVFDVYGHPSFEVIDLTSAEKVVSGYRLTIRKEMAM